MFGGQLLKQGCCYEPGHQDLKCALTQYPRLLAGQAITCCPQFVSLLLLTIHASLRPCSAACRHLGLSAQQARAAQPLAACGSPGRRAPIL